MADRVESSGGNLPVDNGRAPDEPWPWQQADHYGTGLGGKPDFSVFMPVFFAAYLIALPFLGFLWAAPAAGAAGLIASLFSAARFTAYPRPDWRTTSLEAAEHRAHSALMIVDPEFAAEMWSPPERAETLLEEVVPVRRGTPGVGGYEITTGPIIDYEDDYEDYDTYAPARLDD